MTERNQSIGLLDAINYLLNDDSLRSDTGLGIAVERMAYIQFLVDGLKYIKGISEDNADVRSLAKYHDIRRIITGYIHDIKRKNKQLPDQIRFYIDQMVPGVVFNVKKDHKFPYENILLLEKNNLIRRSYLILVVSLELLKEYIEISGIGPEYSGNPKIIRELYFPPDLKQAGLSILSYFREIIYSKYPDLDVGLKIEQRDSRVILEIETPEGSKERIEKELNDYAMVVTGKLNPKDYLANSDEIMRLEHKLELAQMEARLAHQLLHKDRADYQERLLDLKAEIGFLREQLIDDRKAHINVVDELRKLSSSTARSSSKHLSRLIELLEASSAEDKEEEVFEQLAKLKEDDPTVFEKLHQFMLEGSVQGAAGNFLWALLQRVATLG